MAGTAQARSAVVAGSPASLGAIDDRVLRLFAMVSEGLAGATAAFLDDDRAAARDLVAAEHELDSMEAVIEGLIHGELSACPAPVPETARGLVAVLRIVSEIERSGDLVEHIATRTHQGMAVLLSPHARGLIEEMGRAGVDMWRAAAVAYATRDPGAADRLRVLDDRLDDLHVSLCTELAMCLTSVAAAIEMGLIARFFERLGDHAVNVARRVQDLRVDAVADLAP